MNEKIEDLLEQLKKYDNEYGYKLDYNKVKSSLTPTINKIIEIGENSIDRLHLLLENEETWSCLFSLEILKEIKNEKSIPYLIEFIEKNEDGDYFEICDEAMHALINIGQPAVNAIIETLQKGFDNKIFHGYLDEALSNIKNVEGKKFRLEILKTYLSNKEKYETWFNLTIFISGFKEEDKEALPYLKELKRLNLDENELRELKDAIELIEDPEGYKNRLELIKNKFLRFMG